MGRKDKNKDQGDSATATEGVLRDSITSPQDAQVQLGEGSPRCHPSQASSGSHSKGDGQGSCALPGYSQGQRCSCNANQL